MPATSKKTFGVPPRTAMSFACCSCKSNPQPETKMNTTQSQNGTATAGGHTTGKLHETTNKVANKILRSWGDMDSVVFRESEIDQLAADLGYRKSMTQLDGSEWLASILADLGVMPKQKASIFDDNSRFLTFRDGLPVPQLRATQYVAILLNDLLANGGTKLRAILAAVEGKV